MSAIRGVGPRRAGHLVDRHPQLGRALRADRLARAARRRCSTPRSSSSPTAPRPSPCASTRRCSTSTSASDSRPTRWPSCARSTASTTSITRRTRVRARPTGPAARRRSSSREQRDDAELLRVLEIEGPVSREVIIAAYRRLAAQHHPDRFYAEPAEVQIGCRGAIHRDHPGL